MQGQHGKPNGKFDLESKEILKLRVARMMQIPYFLQILRAIRLL